ncbi:MAG: hypothetical protein HXY43_14340 [Fischerella sp.]|uniref:hypothetical protein n=1 Tax=Fischerella sp. TaxID=1191 RepID=UPI0018486E49|nr:hypothetical protein [Fischerella sp.]NWF60400.1 hypothetical protein [Fischerella sp.]
MALIVDSFLATKYQQLDVDYQARSLKLGFRRSLFVRDYQEINYPFLWSGRLARPWLWADRMSTPQEKLYVFLFGSP